MVSDPLILSKVDHMADRNWIDNPLLATNLKTVKLGCCQLKTSRSNHTINHRQHSVVMVVVACLQSTFCPKPQCKAMLTCEQHPKRHVACRQFNLLIIALLTTLCVERRKLCVFLSNCALWPFNHHPNMLTWLNIKSSTATESWNVTWVEPNQCCCKRSPLWCHGQHFAAKLEKSELNMLAFVPHTFFAALSSLTCLW